VRANVREAAVEYLQNANLPFVGTVFAARPEVVDEEDYERSLSGAVSQYVTSQSGSAAVLIVNVPSSDRKRETLTGLSHVEDTDTHELVLELVLANTAGEAVEAQQDHDTVCDAIVASIRADPLLGTGLSGRVFPAGSAQVQVTQSMPFTGADGTTVFILAVIRTDVIEWISGPAGT